MISTSCLSVSLRRCALWIAAISFIASFGAGFSRAAETEDRGQLFTTVTVPSGFTATDVGDAIVATLLGRQWGVKSKTDTEVVGYLKHRSNEATVTLVYDTAKVEIFCVGYEIDKKSGVRKKPEQPTGWLKNIQGDLTKHFNRIATHK